MKQELTVHLCTHTISVQHVINRSQGNVTLMYTFVLTLVKTHLNVQHVINHSLINLT